MIDKIKKGLTYKKVIFPVLLIVLLLFTISPGYAVDYHFEEDFDDSDLSNWTLFGMDWQSIGIMPINHSFTISDDGELVSGGTSSSSNLNGAYIGDNTSVGVWSIDVFVPSNAQKHIPTDRIWGLLFSEVKMSEYEDEPNSTKYPDFGVNFRNEAGNFYVYSGTPGLEFDELISVSLQKFDQKQYYIFVRTTDRFYVFIDSEIALDIPLSSTIGSSINYFSIAVAQGSNVRFDNLKITKDVNEMLNELLSTTSNSATTTGFSILSMFTISLSTLLIRRKKAQI
ncbi:MAG: hypothetical protein ACW97X_14020 [Candidatus Hodarchaeales archaeon]|jgi:hypothetical protein